MTRAELRAARLALGWSASLLGDLTGYTAGTIYAIESGRHDAPGRTLAALLAVLRRGNDPATWGGPEAAPPALARYWRRRGIG
jgi:transcriptional regulator with XRE-family HTH domain